ncbi:MAG: VPLPA-CTERM sorting domain-containing protein [Gammaproteobacteria bacterium]
MTKRYLAATLLIGVLSASSSQAASVSFFLDQSNRLPDNVNYLQVTIADGAAGAIDFTVSALQPLLDIADEGFGIQKFAFNVVGGTATERRDVTALPDEWRARNGGRMDGFGRYDIKLDSHGKNHQDPLTFSITGVDMDTVLSYVDLSTGRAKQGFSFFSARVVGLNNGHCGSATTKAEKSCVESAYFGGTQAVPAPAAIWLLGTAVAGLTAVRRRRTAV